MPDERTPEDEGAEAPPGQDAAGERPEQEAGWAAPHLPPSTPQTSTTPPGDPPPPWSTPGPPPEPPPASTTAPPAPTSGATTPSAAWAPAPTAPAAPPPFTPAVPRTRRRRRWPWILGGVLGLIVVLLVVGIVVFVQKILPPVEAANDYLDDLAAEDYDAAFDQLCEEQQNDSSAATLEEIVENQPVLAGLDNFSVNVFNVDLDGDRAIVEVDLDPDDFSNRDSVFEMVLVKEGGEWRPCGNVAGFR